MFQSLLSWNGLVNTSPSSMSGDDRGVSILVVVERPGQPGTDGCDRSADGVSILVVVERPGQRRTPGPTRCRSRVFQSLLSWNGLVNGFYAIHQRLMESGFNPCCRGTAWSTISTAKPTRPAPPVSILVVVERPGQLRRPRRASESCKCFNPCCRGTAWSTRFGGEAGTGASTVSILVVVELPGCDSGGKPTRASASRCFNPCCRGTAWSTARHAGWPGPLRQVSILVVVERPGQHGGPTEADKSAFEFQSLLSWNGLVNRPRRLFGARAIGSFNPCCRGTAWSTRLVATSTFGLDMFQSLLSWNGLVNLPGSCPSPASAGCFNPCCRGTAWSTPGPATTGCPTSGFQSLLSWNGLVNSGSRSGTRSHPGVSILVVVERPGQRHLHRDSLAAAAEFQSLLSWNGLANMSPRAAGVDVVEFQSLLSWNGLVNAAEFDKPPRPPSWFQSLLSWNGLV